jgi:NAD(P)-dependent dehydrogenase (short-subunit alcohol dehydrogenase family)
MTAKHIIDMTGKVVLVTGGSRGLGRDMALGFAAAGADLIIASRKYANCDAVAEEIRAMGRRALPVGVHMAQWADCDRLIEEAYAEFGRVDVLINNAGMSPLYDKPTDITEELYDKVLDLNLKGPFRMSSVIGERMMEGNGGSIINISSVAAIRPRKNVITYAAAKAGLNAMTEALADAMGPKVRVNGIMPGPFLTDISRAWDMDAFNERAKSNIAMQRGGAPDEITAAAMYLASDHAGYTTGAILKIDGGSK